VAAHPVCPLPRRLDRPVPEACPQPVLARKPRAPARKPRASGSLAQLTPTEAVWPGSEPHPHNRSALPSRPESPSVLLPASLGPFVDEPPQSKEQTSEVEVPNCARNEALTLRAAANRARIAKLSAVLAQARVLRRLCVSWGRSQPGSVEGVA